MRNTNRMFSFCRIHDAHGFAYPFIIAVSTALFTFASCASNPQKNDLRGTWRLLSTADLTSGTIDTTQLTHYIITEEHIMTIGGARNRPKINKNFANMDCEEIATQLPVGGGFMRYEVSGDSVFRTTIYAMSAHYHGETIRTAFSLNGDTLIFRDSHLMDGHAREWTFHRIERF